MGRCEWLSLALVLTAYRGGEDPIGTAPGSSARRAAGLGGEGRVVPCPVQRTRLLGPCHGCAGLGLSLVELLGPCAAGWGQADGQRDELGLMHRSERDSPGLAPGWSSFCAHVQAQLPGCGLPLEPGTARQTRAGNPCLAFLPAQCWLLPQAQQEAVRLCAAALCLSFPFSSCSGLC